MLNRVILEGHLGMDPEKNVTQSGKTVVRFSVPLANPFKRDDDPTEWMTCEVWNQQAEFLSTYGKKGSFVSFEGRLRNQKYQDREGNTRYRVFVAVDRLRVHQTAPRGGEQNGASQNRPNGQGNANSAQNANSSANNQRTYGNGNQSPAAANPPSPPAPKEPMFDIGGDGTPDIEELFKDFDGMFGK